MWDKEKYNEWLFTSYMKYNTSQMQNMGIDVEAELKRLSNLYGGEVKIGDALIMPDAKEDRRKYLLIRR